MFRDNNYTRHWLPDTFFSWSTHVFEFMIAHLSHECIWNSCFLMKWRNQLRLLFTLEILQNSMGVYVSQNERLRNFLCRLSILSWVALSISPNVTFLDEILRVTLSDEKRCSLLSQDASIVPAKVPPSLADPTPAEATEVLEVAMGFWGRSDGKVGTTWRIILFWYVVRITPIKKIHLQRPLRETNPDLLTMEPLTKWDDPPTTESQERLTHASHISQCRWSRWIFLEYFLTGFSSSPVSVNGKINVYNNICFIVLYQ